MRRPAIAAGWLALMGLALAGCNRSPYMAPPSLAAWQPQAVPPGAGPLPDLSQQANALDANNRQLHTQLAQSRQQVKLLQDQVALLQKQLGETAQRLKQMQLAKQEADRKYQALEAATTRRGGAVITANSSLGRSVRKIEIPGLTVRQDGDTVRIELPSDQLFAAGTAQLLGSAFPILDQVAREIARNYPRQLIGIEGHTDTTPPLGGISSHQLAAAQALAVFDQFTRRNRLPAQQFLVIAQGARRPLESNATQAGRARNRRVELVIYPETIDQP